MTSEYMQRILIQTTIPFTEDDWHVGRFSLLTEKLRSLGHAVTARNREAPFGVDDPVITGLHHRDFDQLWLIAVDVGDGLTPTECASIARFHAAGGGLMVTRDHMDLGSSLCGLGGVGAAHYFHTKQTPPEPARCRDDNETSSISWPNFHSGSNGDVQHIEANAPIHPVLRRGDDSTLQTLPAHPHEGGIMAPPGEPLARVVATGKSSVTGRSFNIAVAFEPTSGAGRGWAESTFHHFADYNWNTRLGCPSFVSEKPSSAIERDPSLLDDTKVYVANLAAWLGNAPTQPL
jgi:hypothetical protein